MSESATYQPTNLHKAIRSHSVSLYNERTRENGSGVLVEISGRYFVLTAAHVIQEEVTVFLDLPLPHTRFTILNKWADSDLDVGFLELKSFEVTVLRAELSEPFRIQQKSQASIPNHVPTLALCGFPRAQAVKVQNSELIPVFFLTVALLPHNKWPGPYHENTDPQTKFLIAFGPKRGGTFRDAQGNPMPTPDPHGMSGSGLWYFTRDHENDPKPFYSLVGIQHSYDEFYQVLTGTLLQPVIDSLAKHFNVVIQSR